MLNIKIDGKTYAVKEGKNLLEVCLALGFDLPYFCYHPAMGSVGACRQCAVIRYKDANDTKGRIVMSCMEQVTDGMIISVDDPEAKAFRKSIIESLMLNHPHDCPVCDEGGECHLQDMTMMTGHNYRRTDQKKRTYKNQYLGPFINHEMNRCIECYRCVRFYKDYAGGKDFDVFGSHDHVYFGRHEDGMLESEFSGNLVEVCPTGVFTDKTLRQNYTRKWDMTYTPSVCVNCSVGCNTILGERYGEVRRVISRYNGSVNGYFICDRGRFGYSFINSDQRIKVPMVKGQASGILEPADDKFIISKLKEILTSSKKIIAIGSPKASLESNYLLKKLSGEENFYSGISSKENELIGRGMKILELPGVHSASLKEIETADAVLILGDDVQFNAPMLGLALRQASRTVPIENASKAGIPAWHDQAVRTATQGEKTPFYIAHPENTKLDELATRKYSGDPLKFTGALLSAMSGKNSDDPELRELSVEIITAFRNASSPLIVAGITRETPELLNQIEKLITGFGKPVMMSFVVPHCNSTGLALLGTRSWEEIPAGGEKPIAVILEPEFMKDAGALEEIRNRCDQIILLDHTAGNVTGAADILLPSGTYAETEGTLVNNEGRAQHFYRVLPAKEGIGEAWRWLKEMLVIRGDMHAALWQNVRDVTVALSVEVPVFSGMMKHTPEQDHRMLNEKLKRQPQRFTGRTSMQAHVTVHEPKPPADPLSPFAFSMEGGEQEPPSDLVPFYWVPGWNSNQSMNFYLDEPNGHLKGGDPGIRLIRDKDTQQ